MQSGFTKDTARSGSPCLGKELTRSLHVHRRTRILDCLYRSERAGVFGYFRKTVGADHAGDLTQEVFLRAAKSAQLVSLHNPGGFLHCIARNLAIDFARRRRTHGFSVQFVDNLDLAVNADQDRRMIDSETESAIAEALNALPSRTARIFEMNRYEAKTYRQIHLELGIALGTVDYHMMKALRHLRSALVEC